MTMLGPQETFLAAARALNRQCPSTRVRWAIARLAKCAGAGRVKGIYEVEDSVRMELDGGDYVDYSVMTYSYEPDLTRCFKAAVKRGGVVVDVGANIGYYTLLAAQLVGADGAVYAWEPNAPTYERLLRNIDLNDSGADISTFCEAATASSGRETLYVFKGVSHGHSSLRDRGAVDAMPVEVASATIDSRIASRISVMKIDVEGAELEVVRGAGRTLTQSRPTIFVELVPRFLEEFGESLEAAIYETWALVPGHRVFHLETKSEVTRGEALGEVIRRDGGNFLFSDLPQAWW